MDINYFQSTVAEAREILVVLPREVSFDSVAAGLALAHSLTSYGKKVNIFCPSPMLVEFNRLVGVHRVSDKLGERNLTITLRDYQANNIERVSYDIENGEMKLTIIPKEGVPSPGQEQVALSLSGMSADTAILIGGSGDSQEVQELQKIPKLVAIVKERKPQDLGRQRGVREIVDPLSSSLCETVGLLLTSANLPINEDAANNLLLGLTTATNNFADSRVRAETFEVAGRLLRIRQGGGGTQGVQKEDSSKIVGGAAGQEVTDEPPQDWFKPKIYKGPNLP